MDIDKVVEYTVEEQGSSDYDYVFVVDNLVEDIVDVEFVVDGDMAWLTVIQMNPPWSVCAGKRSVG